MRRTVFTLASALYALSLAGCAAPDASAGASLQNTAWVAESIDGKPVLPDVRSTLRFFDRQFAGGSLGCNAYSTTYFTDGGGLRFGALAPTSKTCAAEVMEQEARFSAVLEVTQSLRYEQSALVLIDSGGKARARLKPLKP